MFAQCKVFLLELYTGDLVSRKSRQDSFFHFCLRQLPGLTPRGLSQFSKHLLSVHTRW